MVQGRFRAAVSPVRRRFDAPPSVLPTVNEVIAASSPGDPVHCIRPRTISEAASAFVASFPGDVLYAVKCNPDPRVLRVLWGAGVRHFDCASAAEVALVRRMFPAADIHFMHPVKARAAIREAWADQGVHDFSFDSQDELAKILAETGAGRASGGAGAPAAQNTRAIPSPIPMVEPVTSAILPSSSRRLAGGGSACISSAPSCNGRST